MTADPCGVMTVEVGCITGELTVVTTDFPQGRVWVAVQYCGADAWYTLDGAPTPLPLGQTIANYHQLVFDAVEAGGEAGVPG
ncbi:hypothetical protein ACFXKJ_41010 [Kitasatospora indigofera]|uniref:hypothetical protein n=1 Tax=Kitasatospora indigofera TaxID=67307 RepID=UPI0036AE6D41